MAFPRFSACALVLTLILLCGSRLPAANPVPQENQSAATPRPDKTGQAASPIPQPLDLSDQVIRDVLTNFQQGIETHNLDMVLGVFDQQDTTDLAVFRDQMAAFFRLHDSVKFRYQLLQVSADNDVGFAIADIDMDADPSDLLPTQQRRSTQMRFQMKHGPKGWKLTGLRPAGFFNQ
jgi:hypothetical protein